MLAPLAQHAPQFQQAAAPDGSQAPQDKSKRTQARCAHACRLSWRAHTSRLQEVTTQWPTLARCADAWHALARAACQWWCYAYDKAERVRAPWAYKLYCW